MDKIRTTESRAWALIEARAQSLGFDAVGVAAPEAIGDAGADLARFVAEGRHGAMTWMAETLERRRHPRALWPEVRSIVVVAANYGPASDPLATLERRDRATISVYARNRDYHALLKGRLKQLAGFVHGRFGAEVKVFVDTAPVMEKPLAQAAGLGWQGKHTNLVSRALGSWTFLGALFTTLDLAADRPGEDHCGQCTRCIDICPTRAITGPYRIDARRCISYLTIELKGTVPRDLRPLIGNRIYGCDDCLAVCPWNKFAEATVEPALVARPELMAPRLADLAGLDDAAFRALFSGSPIKRIGRDRFVRNVLIAIGNSGDAALMPCARALLDDGSALVRGMAVWALARLMPGDAFGRLAERRAPTEADASVVEEWRAATEVP